MISWVFKAPVFLLFSISISLAQIASDGGPHRNDAAHEIKCDADYGRSMVLEKRFLKGLEREGEDFFKVLEELISEGGKKLPKYDPFVVNAYLQCNCPDDGLLELARLWEYHSEKIPSCKQFDSRSNYVSKIKKLVKNRGLDYSAYRNASRYDLE